MTVLSAVMGDPVKQLRAQRSRGQMVPAQPRGQAGRDAFDLTWVALASQRRAHDADLRVCDESVGNLRTNRFARRGRRGPDLTDHGHSRSL
jgi:hypothetical protein